MNCSFIFQQVIIKWEKLWSWLFNFEATSEAILLGVPKQVTDIKMTDIN